MPSSAIGLNRRRRYIYFGQFLFIGLLFGSSFVAIKIGLDYFPPVLLAALRFEIAGLFLLGYAMRTTCWRPQTRHDLLGVLVSGGMVIGLQNALFNVGVQYTTGAHAAILFSLLPIATTLFTVVLLRDERLDLSGMAGIFLGLIGVTLVIDPRSVAFVDTGLQGYLLIIGAVVAAAFGSVLLRRLTLMLSSLAISASGMILGGLVVHAASLVDGESMSAVHWTPIAVWVLAFLALGASGIGYTLYFNLIDKIGPTRANLTAYVNPVVAAIMEWLLFGVTLSPQTLLGFGVISIGFFILEHQTFITEFRTR